MLTFLDNPKKRKIAEENGSQSRTSSKISRCETLKDFSNLSTKAFTQENTEDKEQKKDDTKRGLESESEEKPNKGCVECLFEKELDKRNYYFGNLLIGELQFVQPCMRSVAYMNILKYVDSLKHEHRK
ncbi:unnamed protein product [Colias eurytheme]|nr:unnamed protein product [Colias eurytheme]